MNHPMLSKIQADCNSFYEKSNKLANNIIDIKSHNEKKIFSKEENLPSKKVMHMETNYIPQYSKADGVNKLTPEERLSIQLLLEKQKTCAVTIEKLTALIQSRKLAIQNYELRAKQINDEMRLISEEIQQSQAVLQELKKDHTDLISIMTDKYQLEVGWKFDPETGDIK